MGRENAISQKIKGKVQILKGNIQQATGHELKGGITKMRGKFNDKVAGMKIHRRRRASLV